jgi:hypothetical protein
MRNAIAATLTLAVLGTTPVHAKRKDDVVVMKNGDRMTGEIKKLDRGRLSISSPYMVDAVLVDWRQVERIESKDQFNVSLTTGKIHTGTISKETAKDDESSDFFIKNEDFTVRVPRREVVSFIPVEDSVWKQLTGSIDYGFSFTSGNNSTQSSLSANMQYRAERWFFDVSGTSVFNGQSGASNSGRNTFDFLYARYITRRWYAGAVSELMNSKQQDLVLRATGGGAIGRDLVRTDRTRLAILSGALFSREDYSKEFIGELGGNPRVSNAEALFQLRYQVYTFKKAQLSTEFHTYPSLTTPGRVRMGLQSAMKFELYRNFYWKLSLYESFDSRPPVRAPKNDLGTSTSIGWSF